MGDYYNGQIHGWNGGECPVHPRDHVDVWCRSGVMKSSLAGNFSWDHVEAHHFGRKDDIIAFQVIQRYVEPKVIWVNEYDRAEWTVHGTKEEAGGDQSAPGANRIAVKYVEVSINKEKA